MKFILKDSNNSFEARLRNKIRGLSEAVVFDVTLSNKSEMILMLSDNGVYNLCFSRPLYINVFSPPLADYEFAFSVKKSNNVDEVVISGKVKLKKYVIGALLFLALVLMHKIYAYIFLGYPFSWVFPIGMPSILAALLILEYLLFKRKIKRILKEI